MNKQFKISSKVSTIKGIRVGKTNITSTYTDDDSQSSVPQLFEVTAVSLGTISQIEDIEYTGSSIEPDPIVTAIVNGQSTQLVRDRDYTLSYSDNTDAGQATITATGIGNFTGTTSRTWNITQKEVILVWGTTSWTYDGSAHSTTCTAIGLVTGDSCDVILSGNSITNIGSTTVTATGLSNPNYKLPSVVTQTLVVSPGMFVRLSGTWTPVKEVYKKVSGAWVKQDINTAFSTSEKYLKVN